MDCGRQMLGDPWMVEWSMSVYVGASRAADDCPQGFSSRLLKKGFRWPQTANPQNENTYKTSISRSNDHRIPSAKAFFSSLLVTLEARQGYLPRKLSLVLLTANAPKLPAERRARLCRAKLRRRALRSARSASSPPISDRLTLL